LLRGLCAASAAFETLFMFLALLLESLCDEIKFLQWSDLDIRAEAKSKVFFGRIK